MPTRPSCSTVFNEVARVRGEIELLQGQLNYLQDVVALATLTVHLAPTPEAVPIVEEEWAPFAGRPGLTAQPGQRPPGLREIGRSTS